MTSAADLIVLPGSAIKTSRVGFGCSQLMRITSRGERASLLGAAFDQGVRHFDVARMYGFGAAERELGAFLRGRRDQVTVATKFGIEPRPTVSRLARAQNVGRRFVRRFPIARTFLRRGSRLFYERKDFSAKAAERSLNTSLRELGTDYVDVLLLHEPSLEDHLCDDLREFLSASARAGKIRAFGLAGEIDQILAVEVALGLNAPVLQFATSVLNSDAGSGESDRTRATILFGAISRSLDATLRAIARRRAPWAPLEERMGGDLSQRRAAARMLFWHAVYRNERGITLFSAGSPEHVRELLAPGIDGESTHLFEQIARAELRP